jgi:Ca2+-binding RTX toxin-like protein
MRGLAGNDTIVGGSGHDGLFGGRGNDRLLCGPGNDLLFAGPATASCTAAETRRPERRPGRGHDRRHPRAGADPHRRRDRAWPRLRLCARWTRTTRQRRSLAPAAALVVSLLEADARVLTDRGVVTPRLFVRPGGPSFKRLSRIREGPRPQTCADDRVERGVAERNQGAFGPWNREGSEAREVSPVQRDV